jgi:predicted PurR-regulated permease PerM
MTTAASDWMKRVRRLLVAVFAAVLLILFLYSFRMIVLAGLIGIGIGVLLAPVIRYTRTKAKLPHGVSVTLVVLVLLLTIAGLGYAIYRTVAGQGEQLVQQAPAIIEKLTGQFEDLKKQIPWLGQAARDLNPQAALERAGQMILKGMKMSVEALAGALLMFMLAIFTAANAEAYTRGFIRLFAPRWRPRLTELGHGSARVLRQWFTGQMIVLAISGAMTAIALGLIGVNFWLLIALLTIVLDFIPFFGVLITAAIAVLLTLGTEPDKVWWVLLAYAVIQQIESDVTLPMVMKKRVNLPEAPLLILFLIMGAEFGVLGAFAAPPVYAVVHYLITEGYLPWLERERGRPAAAAG